MEQVTKNLTGLPQSEPQPLTRTFNREEQGIVSWFFASIRTAWGAAKFNSQFGEDDDVRYAKRYWADHILPYSREQLHGMLRAADRERLNGNDKFQWPDIAAILSLNAGSWERRCHKPFESPVMLEDMTTKAAKLEERKAELAKIKKELGL